MQHFPMLYIVVDSWSPAALQFAKKHKHLIDCYFSFYVCCAHPAPRIGNHTYGIEHVLLLHTFVPYVLAHEL